MRYCRGFWPRFAVARLFFTRLLFIHVALVAVSLPALALEPIELGDLPPGHTVVERKLTGEKELNLSFSLAVEQLVSISAYKRKSNYSLRLTPVGGTPIQVRSNSGGRAVIEEILPAGQYLVREKWTTSTRGDVQTKLISKPAPYTAAATTRAQATGFTANAVTSGNWSDPGVWQDGVLPSEGDDVRIAANVDVTLDASPPALGPISILGGLHFGQTDLELHAHSIVIAGGELRVGSVESPHGHQATITIDGPLNVHHDLGGRYLAVTNGGSLELHGDAPAVSWTQLAASVAVGETSFQSTEPTGWQVGDRIVIASSSYDPYAVDEAIIVSVVGTEIEVDRPFRSAHFGEVQDIAGYSVDERAEVALLSRNIVVQGPSYAHRSQAGVHTVVMDGSAARITGVEFRNAGQLGKAGRYPLHWHRVGDVLDQWVRDSSIHRSFHRCVVAYDTNGLEVSGNVTFDSKSHCFVPAESGREQNNVFENNLMILTARVSSKDFAFPRDGFGGSDQSEHRPGGFWMRNVQHNTLRGNHVAGVYQGQGFFFDNRFRSQTTKRDMDGVERPLVFEDNVAHAVWASPGNHLGYGPNTHGHGLFVGNFNTPRTMRFEYQRFLSYKNQLSGGWVEPEQHVVTNSVFADNSGGIALFRSTLEQSLVTGATANSIGGPPPYAGTGHLLNIGGGVQIGFQGGDKQPVIDSVTFRNVVPAAIVLRTKSIENGARISNTDIDSSPRILAVRDVERGALLDDDGTFLGVGRVWIGGSSLGAHAVEWEGANVWTALVAEDEVFPPKTGRNPVTVAKGAYRFDGNQRRIIPHRSGQSRNSGIVEFDFRADDINRTQGLISKDAKGYRSGGHFTVRLVDGKIWARLQSNRRNYILESEPLNANETYRVTVRFGVNGMRLWVNGKYQGKNTYRGGLGNTSGGRGNFEPIVIGANSYGSQPGSHWPLIEHFRGTISRIIWADGRRL